MKNIITFLSILSNVKAFNVPLTSTLSLRLYLHTLSNSHAINISLKYELCKIEDLPTGLSRIPMTLEEIEERNMKDE